MATLHKFTGPTTLPTPLIYPSLAGKPQNTYTTVLLIDSRVKNYQQVVSSVNATTLPIVYSTNSSSQELFAVLQANFTSIPRLGLFFHSSNGKKQGFLNKQPFFLDTEVAPYSDNVAFIITIIKGFSIKNIDFLACSTLNYKNWTNYYALLFSQTGVIVGASNDNTGNLKYGGDWVMESTSQNVELVYFTKNIEYYQYILSIVVDLQTFQLNYPGSVYVILTIDINSFYNYEGFPAWVGGGTEYPLYSQPNWLYDFQLWESGTRIYSFADLDGIVLDSSTPYPFVDPLNLQAVCVAFWTSDENVGALNCNELVIGNISYNQIITDIVNITCFKEDTKILTDTGYRAIQYLRKGDMIKTHLHGFVPIDRIGYHEIIHVANTEKRIKEQLYCCSKEAYPEATEELVITGCHSLLVDRFLNKEERQGAIDILGNVYMTDNKYRLPACVDHRTSVYPEAGEYKVYHFALESDNYYTNYGVYANGILVETTSKRYLKEISGMTFV